MEDLFLFSMRFSHQRFTVVLVVFLLSGVALQWQDFVLHCEGSRAHRPRRPARCTLSVQLKMLLLLLPLMMMMMNTASAPRGILSMKGTYKWLELH
jgi:hypothetical protein